MSSHIVVSNNNHSFPRSEWGIDSRLLGFFSELNNKWFNNSLPVPGGLYYKTLLPKANSREYNGFAHYEPGPKTAKNTCIVISIEYEKIFGEDRTKACLLHEMVHLYCRINDKDHSDRSIDFVYYAGWFHAELHCPYFPEDKQEETKKLVKKEADNEMIKKLFSTPA